jgi:hypothetical protein
MCIRCSRLEPGSPTGRTAAPRAISAAIKVDSLGNECKAIHASLYDAQEAPRKPNYNPDGGEWHLIDATCGYLLFEHIGGRVSVRSGVVESGRRSGSSSPSGSDGEGSSPIISPSKSPKKFHSPILSSLNQSEAMTELRLAVAPASMYDAHNADGLRKLVRLFGDGSVQQISYMYNGQGHGKTTTYDACGRIVSELWRDKGRVLSRAGYEYDGDCREVSGMFTVTY